MSRAKIPAAGDLRTVGGCLLDLDGTIYDSGRLIPGAAEALARLRAAAVPYRFVTNTTRRPRSAILQQLAELGLEAAAEECLTAPVAAAAWLRARRAERILPLLQPATLEDLEGIAVDSRRPQFVLVGDLGDAWSFPILDDAFRALVSGAELVAIQKNRYWRREGRLSLDAGAFVAALEYASGQRAHLLGKPSPDFFQTATAMLGLPPNRVVMVGDDLEADVAGARAAGLLGVAVRTGKYRPEDEAQARRAGDAVLDSIADLPDWLAAAG